MIPCFSDETLASCEFMHNVYKIIFSPAELFFQGEGVPVREKR